MEENDPKMSTEAPPPGNRLDSWKAIAEYLDRDVATVRRWEQKQGLPVRRLPGGRGSSVFAFQSEVDAWLLRPQAAVPAPDAAPAAAGPAVSPRRTVGWPWAAILLVPVAALSWWLAFPQPSLGDLQLQVTDQGLVAQAASGAEQWRDPFSEGRTLIPSTIGRTVQAVAGHPPAFYAAISYAVRASDNVIEGGQLLSLVANGTRRWTFSFDDEVQFGSKSYGAPWAMTDFAVDVSQPGRRAAVAAHHYLWGPSLVAILDGNGQRRATFAHSGWVERVEWLGGDRLLVAGYSEARDGGMVAILDTTRSRSQGAEDPQSEHHCRSCGGEGPLRMVVMPRSEVNRVTHSRFNRAMLELTAERIIARTVEVPAVESGVDAIYEFTRGPDLVGVRYSDRYWETHRALEAQGLITHTRALCPDRDGPRAVQVYTPSTGWQPVSLRGTGS